MQTDEEKADAEAKRLEQHHIDHIKSNLSLTKLAGKTLAERAKLFEVEFPGRKITSTHLRAIYRKHGIKKKKVEQLKLVPNRD